MIEIYQSLIQHLFYSPERHLLKEVFTEKSRNMKWTEYQHELIKTTEYLKDYRPSFLLVDARNFEFVIQKDMQKWIHNNLFSVLDNVGVQKWAVISTPEFVSQISIERAIESKKENKFQGRRSHSEDDPVN